MKAAPEPRNELPGRRGHNNHPGAVIQPKPKCISAQVAKEKAAQQAVKEWLAELEEEKKRLYMQMEIDKENRDLEHEVNAICWLSDIAQHQATNKDAVSSEGEEFDMDVDVSDSDSDGERPEKKDAVSSNACSIEAYQIPHLRKVPRQRACEQLLQLQRSQSMVVRRTQQPPQSEQYDSKTWNQLSDAIFWL